MHLSAKGAAFVRAHEGFRANWYRDPVGIPTIGIGFTMRSASFQLWWARNKNEPFALGASITREQAENALRFLMDREYGLAVNAFMGPIERAQHVHDGMCSPVFNLGPGSLGWRWARAIKDGDVDSGAALLKSTGTTAQGRKLAGLVRRRKEEALLLTKGVYSGIGDVARDAVEPADAMADGMLVRREAGPAVAELIRNLATLGYYDGVIDDLFGRGTEAAVLSFQRAHDLDADGIAGTLTLKAVEDAIERQAMGKEPPEEPKNEIDKIPFEFAPHLDAIEAHIEALRAGLGR